MKKWYQSKTVWFNVLVGLAAVGGFVISDQFPVELTENAVNYIILGVAVINAGLRFLTNTGIGK